MHSSDAYVGSTASNVGSAPPKRRRRGLIVFLWFVLTVILIVGLPLYLCMPLWCDIAFFDICARQVVRGEPVFRDILLVTLPGIVLIQAMVREIVGWRTEALRVVDVLITGLIFLLLDGFLRRVGRTSEGRVCTSIFLCLCYFATTEWCHCQPDHWMLLPSLAALTLRIQQTSALLASETGSQRRTDGRALAEGMCWAIPCTMKFFVAIPALICCLFSGALVLRARRDRWRLVLRDGFFVFVGGMVVLALILGWIKVSGNWPYFIRAQDEGWVKSYLSTSATVGTRTFRLFCWMMPWSLTHLVALPMAMICLQRALFHRLPPGALGQRTVLAQALFAAFYLSWMFQANYLQYQLYYQMAPALYLGLTLIAGDTLPRISIRVRQLGIAGFLTWALVAHASVPWKTNEITFAPHPLLNPQRLAVWPRCWREGSSPDVRDRLALEIHQNSFTTWRDLEKVAVFLKSQKVRDRQLTCFSVSALPLYNELNLKPSSRFVMFQVLMGFYPDEVDRFIAEVMASPQRFIVTDLATFFPPHKIQRPGPLRIPRTYMRQFPFSEPIIFRSGRYAVHLVIHRR